MNQALIEYERLEVKLNDGTIVLGKMLQNTEVVAVTYANRTQAERSAKREGGEVLQRGRPFYVRLRVAGVKAAEGKARTDKADV
jgi:hypothetical protein